MKNYERLRKQVEKQARRMKQAEKDRPTLIAQTVFVGTLGLLFVVPVVAGAYFGRWLDGLVQGYSIHWTLTMIFLGVIIGYLNIYLFIKE